jgi:hypothetical protein
LQEDLGLSDLIALPLHGAAIPHWHWKKRNGIENKKLKKIHFDILEIYI